jgi:hypothetical protein
LKKWGSNSCIYYSVQTWSINLLHR